LDIEADGPIPGPYSMLSLGMSVAARFDGTHFTSRNPEENTFYSELKPISTKFDPNALKVSGLDRERLIGEGRAPTEAMTAAADWVRHTTGYDRPVIVGFPVVFDWLFAYWYFVQFADGGSPFEFSSALDMKTMFQQKAHVVMAAAGKSGLPPYLVPSRPHTHNALADAIEQAELFVRLFRWPGAG